MTHFFTALLVVRTPWRWCSSQAPAEARESPNSSLFREGDSVSQHSAKLCCRASQPTLSETGSSPNGAQSTAYPKFPAHSETLSAALCWKM